MAKCQSRSASLRQLFAGKRQLLGTWLVLIHCRDRCKRVWFRCLPERVQKDVGEIIGRTSERARFHKCHPDTPGARRTFFDQHRHGFDSCGDLIDLIETADATAETMLIPIGGFPEVPLEVVEASGWVDVASGRWRHRNENIIVLESRALTRGDEILASTQELCRKRCVALVDDMAAPHFLKSGDHAISW